MAGAAEPGLVGFGAVGFISASVPGVGFEYFFREDGQGRFSVQTSGGSGSGTTGAIPETIMTAT